MTRGVYLAGPDVFHPDHGRIFTERRATCRCHGLAPLTPLDSGATAAEDENAFLRPDQGRPARAEECLRQGFTTVRDAEGRLRIPGSDRRRTLARSAVARIGDKRWRAEWGEPIRGCMGMIGAIADGEAEVGKAVRGSS